MNIKDDRKTNKMTEPGILLHPTIPRPLHGTAPRIVLGQGWWDKNRQIAYASTDYHCLACGVHKDDAKYHPWLEAHEFYEIDYEKGTMKFMRLVPLCHSCHNFIHKERMVALVKAGKMSRGKLRDILGHGKRVLSKIDVKPKDIPDIQKMAPWGDWVLLLEGKSYKGKFKSFEEWEDFYSKEDSDKAEKKEEVE